MLEPNEKLILLGSLFHDIGKFEQRCIGNPDKLTHDLLSYGLVNSDKFKTILVKIVGQTNYQELLNIVIEHHNKDVSVLTKIIQTADYLSAGGKVADEKNEENKDNWEHKYLSSLFSKINLMSDQKIIPRYYKHRTLSEKDFNIILPKEITDSELKQTDCTYDTNKFNLFLNELKTVLNFYEEENDFSSLINFLLILIEKWTWCLPDYIGNDETDISLFNHLKDVAALSHAIYLTHQKNPQSAKLNLIIGDLPGIQKYIFDVAYKKPAKVLRGRSLYVQIMTRNFATKFLNKCGLTECSLIMLAGGKFYIIAPDTEEFKNSFDIVQKEIESYLFEIFRMDLSFNSVYYQFDYSDLLLKKKTFGQIIEEASFKLLENRYGLYKNRLLPDGDVDKKNYIWKEDYIDGDETGTDSMKCAVTNKPIRKTHHGTIEEITTKNEREILNVVSQVQNEYEIGSKVPYSNLLIQIEDDGFDVLSKNIKYFNNMKREEFSQNQKLLVNPNLDLLFNKISSKELNRNILINANILEVANYCSLTKDIPSVLPFEDMVKEQEGAKYLSLIKGDIDNLGLIMAYGLTDDNNDASAFSQTTTLSNHLKYYFSYFINGFLQNWEKEGNKIAKEKAKKEKPEISEEELNKVINKNRVYTIFAGGDDLMLITPQQSAVKLINEFNKTFHDFVCCNDEVHISYSITNFKDHSPIRIIADIAEENQKDGKNHNKLKQFSMLEEFNVNSFNSLNDKAGTGLFNGLIKNVELEFFIQYADMLSRWINENEISHGLLQKLLDLSEMQRKYKETLDGSYLIAYARATYTIMRIINLRPEISIFLKNALIIEPEKNSEADKIKSILNPLICQVIYNTRN